MSSLLAPNQNIGPSPLDRQTRQILTSPRHIAEQMARSWINAFDTLWQTNGEVTPADKLAAIGTDGQELMESSEALVTFIASVLSGKDDVLLGEVLSRVETMPELLVGEDGTVTIVA